jgi:nucleoside-diphosphate-sugar epimerase
MTILVTGSSGFIGSKLCGFFAKKKILFYSLDKKIDIYKNNFYLSDILNKLELYNIIKKIRPKYIIHAAARTDLHGTTLIDYKENYLGTLNIIKAANQVNSVKRIIFFSTLLVNKIDYNPRSLRDYNPDTYYGQSKVLMEKLILKSKIKAKWCIVRPTTVWGPGVNNHFKTFLKLINYGLYFNISNKKTFKTYGYIENIIYQIYKLIYTEPRFFNSKTYYLADYKPLCIEDWANQISIILRGKKNNELNYKILKLFALLGDLLEKLNIRAFPLNSRRLNNMTANLIRDVEDLKEVCGNLPVNFNTATKRFAKLTL